MCVFMSVCACKRMRSFRPECMPVRCMVGSSRARVGLCAAVRVQKCIISTYLCVYVSTLGYVCVCVSVCVCVCVCVWLGSCACVRAFVCVC